MDPSYCSNNYWMNQPNQYPAPSAYTNYFNHQAGYVGQEPGHNQYGHFGQYHVHQLPPFPSPYLSHIMHERDNLKREIEKERAREQIIVAEITNRRAMEAEVRRELMMYEEELARQRERNALLLGLPPVSNLIGGELDRPRESNILLLGPPPLSNPMEGELARPRDSESLLLGPPPVSTPMEGDFGRQRESKMMILGPPPVSNPMEGHMGRQIESSNALLLPPASAPMEETIADAKPMRVAFSAKKKLNAASSISHGVVKFQTRAGDLKVSKVKPVNVTEKGKEEKKAVLLAKPSVSIAGSKRKAAAPPLPDSSNLKKKAKRFSRCDLCHVKVDHEANLNMHLSGKKHKMKEVELQDQISRSFGRNPTTPVSTNTVGTATDSPLLNKPQSLSAKNEDSPANHKPADNLNKRAETVKNDPKKIYYTFWCKMCKVGSMSQNNMDAHKKGKKHAKQLKEANTGKPGKCNKS